MRTALITISEAGQPIARTLLQALQAQPINRTATGQCWNDFDAFIFIGAMGICVRTIAPYIKDKHTDPAVVCVSTTGNHVVSVLSGHVGGANDLTNTVAAILGAEAVITTQSDNASLWALDTFEKRFGWSLTAAPESMNPAIFAFVNREPTALLLEVRDEGTDYLERRAHPAQPCDAHLRHQRGRPREVQATDHRLALHPPCPEGHASPAFRTDGGHHRLRTCSSPR